MKKMLVASLILFVACETAPPQRRMNGPRAEPSSSGLDFIPLTDWWRQPAIAGSLNLTNDQYASLDRIAADQREEIARLERDSGMAMRDLRQSFDSNPGGITTAAQRVRSLRDNLFDRQVSMLSAERQVLNDQQWQALQQALQSERMDRRDDFGGARRGGRRGGTGGRGRWPGLQ